MKIATVKDVNVWTTSTYVVQYLTILLWGTWYALPEPTQQEIINLMFGRYAPLVAIAMQVAATMAARKTTIQWSPPWAPKETESEEGQP